MCNLYSITTNQAAIAALFRRMNLGNLPPIPGVFPDYPAPVVRNARRRARADHDKGGLFGRSFRLRHRRL
jgi:putative SOS response-associated peptidase YedK